MGRQNVVNAIPMDVIWDENWRILRARRVGYVDADQIREPLRSDNVFVLVGDIGSDLIRLSGTDVYAFWKEEAQPRLVPPDKTETGFSLDDYDGEYCYLASAWAGTDLDRQVILFEKYH